MGSRIATIFLFLSFLAQAFGGTYYFRLDGNDSADGSDWANAKSNLQGFVLSQTGGGNSIWVGPGTWQMTNGPLTVAKNTTVAGSSNRTESVLKGAAGFGVAAATGTNVVFSTLTIYGGSNTAANMSGGIGGYHGVLAPPHTLITNCLVVSNYSSSANIGSGARLCSAVDSEFLYNSGSVALYLYDGFASNVVAAYNLDDGLRVRSGTATACRAVGNAGSGIYSASGGSAVGCSTSNNAGSGIYATLSFFASGCTASSNAVYGLYGGSSAFASNCVVERNANYGVNRWNLYGCRVVSNSTSSGSAIGGAELRGPNWATNCVFGYNGGYGASGGYLENCVFEGNAADGANTNGLGIYQPYSARGCTVIGHAGLGAPISGASYSQAANCLVWSNGKDQVTTPATNSFSNVSGIDPLFISGTLIPTSTNVVDRGNTTYATAAVDFRGSNRFSGVDGLPDVGAYELQSGDVPVPPAVSSPSRKLWFAFTGGVI